MRFFLKKNGKFFEKNYDLATASLIATLLIILFSCFIKFTMKMEQNGCFISLYNSSRLGCFVFFTICYHF